MKALLIGIVVALSVISLQGQDGSGSKSEAYYCPPCNNHCDKLTFWETWHLSALWNGLDKANSGTTKKKYDRKKIDYLFLPARWC